MSDDLSTIASALGRLSSSEYLARFESDCRNASIPECGHAARIYTPTSVHSTNTTMSGKPVEVRPMLRFLIGSSFEPYSVSETEALTEALEIRFAIFKDLHTRLQKKVVTSEEGKKHKTKMSNELEDLMIGYMNLVCQVNFETLAAEDPSNQARVEGFLKDNREVVVESFSGNGDAEAFLERTQGLSANSLIKAGIIRDIGSFELQTRPDPKPLSLAIFAQRRASMITPAEFGESQTSSLSSMLRGTSPKFRPSSRMYAHLRSSNQPT